LVALQLCHVAIGNPLMINIGNDIEINIEFDIESSDLIRQLYYMKGIE
jgi:hypothetical protein